MNEKMLELVIMLNGNFCVIPLKSSQVEDIKETLLNAIKAGITDPYFFFNYGGYFALAKHIVGFYIREPVENVQSKAIKILEKMESGGEDWKNPE